MLIAARGLAIFTESVNWDEFALLHRAHGTVTSGTLEGGGRPGLATLLLTPFAAACQSAISALVQARVLWTGMVVASAVAFWYLLRAVLPPSPYRWPSLTTGLGLWVLAPAFVRYSIQVRTDQPAILLGLLGGLALVHSRQRIAWAPAAGALFGIGFLFSQKLLYVGGLVGVLALGQLMIHGDWRHRRELLRAAFTATVFVLIIIAYRMVMFSADTAPAMLPVAGAMSVFDYYRQYYGWRLYAGMLPGLVPQVLAIVCLVAGTAGWLRYRGRDGSLLLTAWLVFGVGLVVLGFHAARFPYFYMALGLFPAAIGALVIGPVLERMATARGRSLLIAVIWIPLVALGLRQAWATTLDAQALQRDSLDFIDRNFAAVARGFQTHGAFVCREDPDHFPVRFRQHVVAQFSGVEGTARARELIDEFRRRPVAFMMWPPEQYHDELGTFWATRYVHYYGAVHVAGRQIRGQPGASGEFEVVVPGEYMWRTTLPDSGRLEVAGQTLAPGGTITLSIPAVYRIGLPEGGEGMIVLALSDPPAPDPRGFYTGW